MSYLEKKISTTDNSQDSLINKSRKKKKKGKPKLTVSEKKEDRHIIREIITTYIQLSAFLKNKLIKVT